MQDQRSGEPVDREALVDRAVLGLLINDEACGPWSQEEVVREIGDQVEAMDSIARLHRAGLVHRLDVYAFATRAAITFASLNE